MSDDITEQYLKQIIEGELHILMSSMMDMRNIFYYFVWKCAYAYWKSTQILLQTKKMFYIVAEA